jgi:hypothetical protein
MRRLGQLSRGPGQILLWLVLACSLAPVALAFDPGELRMSTLPVPPDYDPAARLILPGFADGEQIMELPEALELFLPVEEFSLERSSVELFINGVEYSEELEFWLDRVTLGNIRQIMQDSGSYHIEARVRDAAGAYWDLSNFIQVIPKPCLNGCPWPFADTAQPDVVSNLMEDFQSFNINIPSYWHGGIDIRVPAGTMVHAANSGTVVKVDNYASGALYWSVGIQDSSGIVWQYHHMDPTTITVTEGASVTAGDPLGEVIAWTWSMNGSVYHHLHLNTARWDGGGPIPAPYVDGWTYFNPLRFLKKGSYVESEAPMQFDVYYAENEATTAFAADSEPGTPVLQGDVDVVTRLADHRTLIPPAMGQLYELGIYDLAYEIVPISTPCMAGGKPRTLLAEFKKLPGGSSESAQIAKLHEVFEDTFTWSGSEVGSHFSNVTQELTYTLTNSLYGYLNGPLGMWDTDATAGWKGGVHPDGLYSILIHASDIDGNATVNSFTVELDNGLGFNGYCLGFIPVDGPKWVHPIEIVSLVSGGSFSIPPPPSAPMQFAAVGQDRIARATVSAESWPVWSFDVPEAGERVHIGMLSGQLAEIEYDPVLGDVVVHAPVEVQTEPMAATGKAAGGFDPGAASTQPIDLHYTTRLVRDPASGEALVGGPMGPSGEFKLVLAEQILVGNAPFVIRTPGTGGVEASIEQIAAVPALSVWSRVVLGLLILSATTSLGFAARRGVVSERG